MAEENEGEDEVLQLTEDQIIDPNEGDEDQDAPGDDEEVVVSFEGEAPPASGEQDSSTIRQMRQALLAKEERIKELELKNQQPAVSPAGPRPTQWDEGIDGDEEIFAQKIIEWDRAVQKEEEAKTVAQKETEQVQLKFQSKLSSYETEKTTLGIKDFADAEAEVKSALSDAQKGILVHGAEKPALLIAALGKSPEKLKALAAITDPIEFAFAAAKLEGQAKMERRRPATSPESQVSGSAQLGKPGGKLDDKLSPEEWNRRRNEQVRKR